MPERKYSLLFKFFTGHHPGLIWPQAATGSRPVSVLSGACGCLPVQNHQRDSAEDCCRGKNQAQGDGLTEE